MAAERQPAVSGVPNRIPTVSAGCVSAISLPVRASVVTDASFQLPAGCTPAAYALPAPIATLGIVCDLQHCTVASSIARRHDPRRRAERRAGYEYQHR